jgi:hypothetical protein
MLNSDNVNVGGSTDSLSLISLSLFPAKGAAVSFTFGLVMKIVYFSLRRELYVVCIAHFFTLLASAAEWKLRSKRSKMIFLSSFHALLHIARNSDGKEGKKRGGFAALHGIEHIFFERRTHPGRNIDERSALFFICRVSLSLSLALSLSLSLSLAHSFYLLLPICQCCPIAFVVMELSL